MKYRLILIGLIILVSGGLFIYINHEHSVQEKIRLNEQLKREKLLTNIKNSYSQYVVTKSKAKLYIMNGESYIYKGDISKNINISLDKIDNITINDTYFKITGMPYYIYYSDVNAIANQKDNDKDYKNYILFNENVITNVPFNLYDDQNNLAFTFTDEMSLPIIIKDNDKYYVEYNDSLLYVLKDEVRVIQPSQNTNESYATGVAALNYHFFYDDSLGEQCNQIICLKSSLFEEQLNYLVENNFYTTTMKDLELFIDGKIRLPQNSVSLTIDDGGMGVINKAIPLLEKYKKNATLFLVTAWGDKSNYASPYLEFHSHGHDIHNQGACSGGQGGAIKCLAKDKLLNDLATSRGLLNNSTVFCYPFYEYNDYAINILKEAGFSMAFASGKYKIKPGANKFVLPRYVIYSYTTLNEFAKMIR